MELIEALINNIPAIITAITAILSSFLTFIATYLIIKNQYKIKITEIKGQSELKAREHLFNSYQERMQKVNEGFSEISASVFKTLGQVESFDENLKNDTINKTFELIRKYMTYNSNFLDELENELKKEKLYTSNREKDFNYIKNTSTDIIDNKFDEEKRKDIFYIVVKIEKIISDAKLDLFDKKSNDLFKDFITDKS